jgi:hypothetical protein
MAASLSYSVASLLTDPAEQEEALRAIAKACSGVEFVERIGERSVRVSDAGIEDAPAPAHLGQTIVTDARDKFFLFEDHGDLLLPGWDPATHEFELEIGGEARVLGDLGQMIREIDEVMADEEYVGADRSFLQTVREALEIARTERLAVVAHW